jgi:hypothetical protein
MLPFQLPTIPKVPREMPLNIPIKPNYMRTMPFYDKLKLRPLPRPMPLRPNDLRRIQPLIAGNSFPH